MDRRRRSPRDPPGLYTRSVQMYRLALTVGEVSLTSVSQVILLLPGSFVAHLDMPLPCGLREGKAASLLPMGDAVGSGCIYGELCKKVAD